MLSVALVRSAGGAANYFAADNYYSRADAERSGEWLGMGARTLGLEGRVEAKVFDALLRGHLPGGLVIGQPGNAHRAGIDLTFSMPKSWSLLALLGGDKRIVEAYREAVKEALTWAEKNAAQARIGRLNNERLVDTGNLAIALFQHDTNRNREPNVHFHAVVANATQLPDGTWRALRNDKLWSLNTLLNAIAMARFRERVGQLGYEAGPTLKHGNFEAHGVSREAVMAFSTRRKDILEQAANMANRGPRALDAATLMTRSAKGKIEDREQLAGQWRHIAREAGIDMSGVVSRAHARSVRDLGLFGSARENLRDLGLRGLALLGSLADKAGLSRGDPLLPAGLERKHACGIAGAVAAASAIRHLSEREAALAATDVYMAALGFGLPATIDHVEAHLARLVANGVVLRGEGADRDKLTTLDALATEQRILAEADKGRNAVTPILSAKLAGQRMQHEATARDGIRLNRGQEAAARLVLASSDRIVAVQGVAGAGKSTMLRPLAAVLRAEGHKVLGLAVQNTLVRMLEQDTAIPSMTVARFLGQHRSLLESKPDAKALSAARREWSGAVLFLDEASMLGNADQEKLARLANLLSLQRFAMIGDKRQLGAVDAGKPFAILQAAGVETATMNRNVRARGERLRQAQRAAQTGEVAKAMELLAPDTVATGGNLALAAAESWLRLAPQDRSRTAIYVSGRRLRAEVNDAVQAGRHANGELGEAGVALETLVRANTTREELRHSSTYSPGLLVRFPVANRAQRIPAGSHNIEAVDARKGAVTLRDSYGVRRTFRPDRIRARAEREPLELFEQRNLTLYAGDPVRWTATDRKRGLVNADRAEVLAVEKDGITVRTGAGSELKLGRNDWMLRRLDLAYALNAHMAQGLTSDRGIAVMDSSERKLASQQTFLVTITRLRDGLTLITDSPERLGRAIARNPGDKTSAIESIDRLKQAAAHGLGIGRGPEAADIARTSEPPDLQITPPRDPEKAKADRADKPARTGHKPEPELQKSKSKVRSKNYGLGL